MYLLSKFRALSALCCFLCLGSLPAAWSQDFLSIDGDLEQLENLIHDTLRNTREQELLLEDLKKNLEENGSLIGHYETIISERENLLRDLQTRLAEMSETYRMQSALSAKYERSSKFWKIFTLIAVPAAAALSGGIVYGICGR